MTSAWNDCSCAPGEVRMTPHSRIATDGPKASARKGSSRDAMRRSASPPRAIASGRSARCLLWRIVSERSGPVACSWNSARAWASKGATAAASSRRGNTTVPCAAQTRAARRAAAGGMAPSPPTPSPLPSVTLSRSRLEAARSLCGARCAG
eukprot:scaffold40405_cov67-Phaeocystis_antarctica.AAC.5